MANDRRTLRALAALLPAGALGLSMSLAAADASAARANNEADGSATTSVAERLQSIRNSVSTVVNEATKDSDDPTVDRDVELAWWGNGGWRNGGWHNGGWHNWGNGWHNGWGNGGWHNWGNGWHNW
jgi:rSAM-associated Gly-rich repeat protein